MFQKTHYFKLNRTFQTKASLILHSVLLKGLKIKLKHFSLKYLKTKLQFVHNLNTSQENIYLRLIE